MDTTANCQVDNYADQLDNQNKNCELPILCSSNINCCSTNELNNFNTVLKQQILTPNYSLNEECIENVEPQQIDELNQNINNNQYLLLAPDDIKHLITEVDTIKTEIENIKKTQEDFKKEQYSIQTKLDRILKHLGDKQPNENETSMHYNITKDVIFPLSTVQDLENFNISLGTEEFRNEIVS